MAEAYCVKDKQKVEVVNPQRITMKNGKAALAGDGGGRSMSGTGQALLG